MGATFAAGGVENLSRVPMTSQGAAGGVILSTLLDEMDRSARETGLGTLFIASGIKAATITERVKPCH
ncbi:MAG TPA: hypothetical protein DIU07_01990 [Rhodobacteraceae bacterium]|nr:hypothetical protein [Paracoccaceae bacterium]